MRDERVQASTWTFRQMGVKLQQKGNSSALTSPVRRIVPISTSAASLTGPCLARRPEGKLRAKILNPKPAQTKLKRLRYGRAAAAQRSGQQSAPATTYSAMKSAGKTARCGGCVRVMAGAQAPRNREAVGRGAIKNAPPSPRPMDVL